MHENPSLVYIYMVHCNIFLNIAYWSVSEPVRWLENLRVLVAGQRCRGLASAQQQGTACTRHLIVAMVMAMMRKCYVIKHAVQNKKCLFCTMAFDEVRFEIVTSCGHEMRHGFGVADCRVIIEGSRVAATIRSKITASSQGLGHMLEDPRFTKML